MENKPMMAMIRKTELGFETTVLNEDFNSQPSPEEQRQFMIAYARSVLNISTAITEPSNSIVPISNISILKT